MTSTTSTVATAKLEKLEAFARGHRTTIAGELNRLASIEGEIHVWRILVRLLDAGRDESKISEAITELLLTGTLRRRWLGVVTVRHMATLAGLALVAGCGRVVGPPTHEPAHDAISREEVLGRCGARLNAARLKDGTAVFTVRDQWMSHTGGPWAAACTVTLAGTGHTDQHALWSQGPPTTPAQWEAAMWILGIVVLPSPRSIRHPQRPRPLRRPGHGPQQPDLHLSGQPQPAAGQLADQHADGSSALGLGAAPSSAWMWRICGPPSCPLPPET